MNPLNKEQSTSPIVTTITERWTAPLDEEITELFTGYLQAIERIVKEESARDLLAQIILIEQQPEYSKLSTKMVIPVSMTQAFIIEMIDFLAKSKTS